MQEQCYALLIDADNVSAKIHQADPDRIVKIWDHYIQKNIRRLDEHTAFKLER